MRIAIIGAGVFGLAAALQLARRGHGVTVFEADTIPAEKAASNDVSKALRRAYGAATPRYGPLAVRARDAWRDLERATGLAVYHETGYLGLSTSLVPGSFEHETLGALASIATPADRPLRLSAAQARAYVPSFGLDGVDGAFFDPLAGWLEPGLALEALARAARAAGARIETHHPVRALEDLDADAVLVAAGAWIKKLVPSLPLTVTPSLQVELLYRVRAGTDAPKAWPFWSLDIATQGFYGFPQSPDGLFKIACHQPGRAVDPDAPRIAPPADVETIAAFVRARMPFLADTPELVRTCLYTMTEDGDFVFDRVPHARPLFVAGCGSGHAFKFGPLLGVFAADAIEGRTTPPEFRLYRQSTARTV